jgi:hypothetical protein
MRKVLRGKAFLRFLTVSVCTCWLSASAGLVSYDISVIFEGPGVPSNPAPWLNVTFDDGGTAGTVDLTITVLNLVGDNEKVAGLYLNLDPFLDPADLLFSAPIITGTLADPVISLGADAYQADGDGNYDILIDFDNDGPTLAFNGGESVYYTITHAGLTADSFDFTSTPGGGTGTYKVAVHLLGLGAAEDSAWATVPEPATLVLLAFGGLSLRKRK